MPLLFIIALASMVLFPHVALPLAAVLVAVGIALAVLQWLSGGGTEAVVKFFKQDWWLWPILALLAIVLIARHA